MKRPLPLSRHAFVSLLALAINQVSSFALSPTAAALPRTLRRALGAQTGRRSASSGRPGVLQAEMQAQAGGGGDVSAARVELFFKSDSELRSRVRMLSSIGVSAFSIVNKDKSDKLLGWLDAVAEEAPGASVCVHYSLKYNRERFPPRQSGDLAQATYSKFFQYLDKVAERAGIAQPEVLLITGSGPKVPPEATGCLESLAMHLGGKLPPVPVGVAFNPYFEDAETRAAERARLERKLRTGVVDTVWLQFGSSPEMLAEGLEWLRGLGDGMAPRRIVGSMFLPNKVLIAQQKFRPWNGVFLSEEYLSGPGQAMEVTRKLLAVYTRFGVEALIEAPGVKTDKDIAVLRDIMRSHTVPARTYQVPMSDTEKSKKAPIESTENPKTVAAVMSEIPVHNDPAPKRVRVARLGRSTRVGANLG